MDLLGRVDVHIACMRRMIFTNLHVLYYRVPSDVPRHFPSGEGGI